MGKRNRRKKLQRVRGKKKKQEVFSGRAEKVGSEEAEPGRRGNECLGHFQVLAVDPRNSWQPLGLEEGYAVVYSADLGLWLKLFGCRAYKGLSCEGVRVKSLANFPRDLR